MNLNLFNGVAVSVLRNYLLPSRPTRTLLFVILLLGARDIAFSRDWEPINPADLAAKESVSAPGADLEILLSKHVLDTAQHNNWIENTVQAKVYTPKGVDRLPVLKIEYLKKHHIEGVAARLLKQDGSTVELNKKDFHETTVMKRGEFEWKRTSFAVPNVAPGDIVEYRWSQSIETGSFSNYTSFCQEPVPVREYIFNVESSASDFNIIWFNSPKAEYKKVNRYRTTLRMTNLPAFNEEKWMPPEREFRSWVLVVFSHPFLRYFSNEEVWKEIGGYVAEEFRLGTKPSGRVKSKAAELIKDAANPDEKLSRLYEFCQSEIANIVWLKSADLVTAKESRDKENETQSPDKTMERRSGNPIDINWLFASLARSAGFDVRSALSVSRKEILNIQTPKGWMFLDRQTVAVRVGEAWQFYSPGQYYVPAGLLSTDDEGVAIFLCDEKKSRYETFPSTPPERTLVRRKGRFTLDEEGALDGTVEIRFSGHAGVTQKTTWSGKDEADATKDLLEKIAAQLPTAEVSEIVWENLNNRKLPVIARYKLHAPGYAEVAGTRLIVAPNYFEAGASPVFTAESRLYPIFLDFAQKSQDDIEMVLPEGYVLDGGSAPANVAHPSGLVAARYGLRYSPKTRVLAYQRECVLGDGGIAFRAESYSVLKQLFDDIGRSDQHRFVLKPKSVSSQNTEKVGATTAAK